MLHKDREICYSKLYIQHLSNMYWTKMYSKHENVRWLELFRNHMRFWVLTSGRLSLQILLQQYSLNYASIT